MTTKPTKQNTIIKLLMSSQGAAVEQLRKATGWQPHSIRAALTGLCKKGHNIIPGKNAKGVTVCLINKSCD